MASTGPASSHSSPLASIGVPKEIKRDERRVALTPDGAHELVSQGMEVRIEAGRAWGPASATTTTGRWVPGW